MSKIKFKSTTEDDNGYDVYTTSYYEPTLEDATDWYNTTEKTIFLVDVCDVDIDDEKTIDKIEEAYEALLNS